MTAGVVEDGAWTASEQGAPQGASASPLLANVYLHYVLDLWVRQFRRRPCRRRPPRRRRRNRRRHPAGTGLRRSSADRTLLPAESASASTPMSVGPSRPGRSTPVAVSHPTRRRCPRWRAAGDRMVRMTDLDTAPCSCGTTRPWPADAIPIPILLDRFEAPARAPQNPKRHRRYRCCRPRRRRRPRLRRRQRPSRSTH